MLARSLSLVSQSADFTGFLSLTFPEPTQNSSIFYNSVSLAALQGCSRAGNAHRFTPEIRLNKHNPASRPPFHIRGTLIFPYSEFKVAVNFDTHIEISPKFLFE